MDAKSRAQTDASALDRTSSGRCCAPVEGSLNLMDRFEPSRSMPAWIVQQCRCNSSSYYGLNRKAFSGKIAALVVNLRYFTLKFIFLIFWSENTIVLYLKYFLLNSLTS